MSEFEQLLGLFVAAVILAAAARRVGALRPIPPVLSRLRFSRSRSAGQ